ncbi:hypothetical protein ACTFIY_009238 [Dictyostelium cf. discoideum]
MIKKIGLVASFLGVAKAGVVVHEELNYCHKQLNKNFEETIENLKKTKEIIDKGKGYLDEAADSYVKNKPLNNEPVVPNNIKPTEQNKNSIHLFFFDLQEAECTEVIEFYEKIKTNPTKEQKERILNELYGSDCKDINLDCFTVNIIPIFDEEPNIDFINPFIKKDFDYLKSLREKLKQDSILNLLRKIKLNQDFILNSFEEIKLNHLFKSSKIPNKIFQKIESMQFKSKLNQSFYLNSSEEIEQIQDLFEEIKSIQYLISSEEIRQMLDFFEEIKLMEFFNLNSSDEIEPIQNIKSIQYCNLKLTEEIEQIQDLFEEIKSMQNFNLNSSEEIGPKQDLNPSIKHHKEQWEIISKIFNECSLMAKKTDGKINGINVSLCMITKIFVPSYKYNSIKSGIEFFKKINPHYYLMKYYGYGMDGKDLYIYTEYNENVIPIKEKLKELPKNRFGESEIKSLMIKIVRALIDIYESSAIVYFFIKGDNIFLIQDKSKNNQDTDIKLFDLDLPKYFERKGRLSTQSQKNQKYVVFSLGRVMVEMASTCTFQMEDYIYYIEHLSNSLKNIIQRCLQFNLDARYSLYDLLKHLSNDTTDDNKIKIPSGFNISSDLKRLELETNEPTSKNSLGNDTNDLPNFNHQIVLPTKPSPGEYLSLNINEPLQIGSIPASVKYLDLGNEFDIQTNGDNIPNENVVVLRCGFKFSKVIHKKCIPSSVTDLQLHNYNIELNLYSIPSSVVSLSLGSNFTDIKSLFCLPDSIIDLTFNVQDENEEISKEIDNIKPRITSLIVNGKQRRN